MNKRRYCSLCGKVADTREHVFAKCFFDKPYPEYMLTVPSCHKCNQSFSADEQYLMYLIDYLKSIETNNGDFTRKKAEATFLHNDKLEDRMITSLQLNNSDIIFNIEKERIDRVARKIARCLYMYCFDQIIRDEKTTCIWAFKPWLSADQLVQIGTACFTVLQERNVECYCTRNEAGFCLNDYFYACVQFQ